MNIFPQSSDDIVDTVLPSNATHVPTAQKKMWNYGVGETRILWRILNLEGGGIR